MDYRKNDKNVLSSSNRSKKDGLYDPFQIRDTLNESFDLSQITVSESLIQMTLQKARLQDQGMNGQNGNIQDQEMNIQNENEQGQRLYTEEGYVKDLNSIMQPKDSLNGSIPRMNPGQQQEHKDIKKKKTNFYQLGLAAACVGLLFIGALALKDQDFNFTLGSSKKDSATQEYVSETAESSSYDDAAATEESTAAADQATEKADVAQDYSVAADNAGEESSNVLESEATADTAQAKDSGLGEQKSEDVQTDTFVGASDGSLKNDIFRIQTEDMDTTISPEEIASIGVYDGEETLIEDITAKEDINIFYKKLGSIAGNTTDSYNNDQYERHYMISAKAEQTWKELHIWVKDSLRCQVTTESGEVIESSFIPTNPSDLEDLSN
ncbi:MAG TPA: hypothetical protein VHP81_05025 [Lachnospiraceae bacterium]|nr:hypothetical protein [Lachnospiraceae bacterium]